MVEFYDLASFSFSIDLVVVRVGGREGTGWLEQMLIKMEKGEADTREIPMLEEISRAIEGHTICALGDAAAWPVQVNASMKK